MAVPAGSQNAGKLGNDRVIVRGACRLAQADKSGPERLVPLEQFGRKSVIEAQRIIWQRTRCPRLVEECRGTRYGLLAQTEGDCSGQRRGVLGVPAHC